MSAIDVSQISSLSDIELVNFLTAYDLPSGPITKTTRMVFENLLRARLKSKTGKCNTNTDGEQGGQELMGKGKSNDGKICRRGDSIVDHGGEPGFTEADDDMFYGVCYGGVDATDGCKIKQTEPLVFNSQQHALEAVKNRKGSRFKAFRTRAEAESFSLSETLYDSLAKDVSKLKIGGEPLSSFKTPTPREIISFRKAIESGDIDLANEKLFSNPKYLVSSGETPVVLQEGSRYNAMHVAVRSRKLSVCELVINTLSENRFWNLLFPETSDTGSELLSSRKQRMVDLYLNTPDKGACETPLHMACKNGYIEIVEYLKSFSSLVTDSKNVHGETPSEVICSRYNGPDREILHNNIVTILEGRSYIPVFRPEDGSSLPYVGRPVAQTIDSSSSEKADPSPETHNPLDFKYVVKAYAGPMSPQKASALYQRWIRSPKEREWYRVTREDFDKGLERIGRRISTEEGVPWTEYWSFLGCFENLSSESGLIKLENHLASREEGIRRNIIKIYSTPQRYQKSRTMRRLCPPAIARVQGTSSSLGRQLSEKYTTPSRGGFNKTVTTEDDVKKKLFTEGDGKQDSTSEIPQGSDEGIKTDTKLKLVRQEACYDPRDAAFARLKLSNIRSLSAGDAEVKTVCDPEGIPLKYSFDLEESFQSSFIDSASTGKGRESPSYKAHTSRKPNWQGPTRAYSDVTGIGSSCGRQVTVPWCNSSGSPNTSFDSSPTTPPRTDPRGSQLSPYRSFSTLSPPNRLTSVLTPATEIGEVGDIEIPLFIEGLQPTKMDLDVLRALHDISIDPSRFPCIWKWKLLVSSYSNENQQSWPSPGSPRYRSRVFDKAPIWSC